MSRAVGRCLGGGGIAGIELPSLMMLSLDQSTWSLVFIVGPSQDLTGLFQFLSGSWGRQQDTCVTLGNEEFCLGQP